MKRYEKYKPSGVEWIGEVPEHWDVNKLKYRDDIIMGQSPSSDDYNYVGIGLPFIQGNAEFKELHPQPKLWCETANKVAIADDILVSVRAPIGAVNIADQKIGIGRGLCAIRANQDVYKFLYYHFLILNEELNSIGTGSTYTQISAEEVRNVFLIIPTAPEQTAIFNYLDDKTAQIDTLNDKKQKLIDLLKEERRAIINHAVTKGINPNVKLKPSGIDWLGDPSTQLRACIPEHWEVKKLKYVAEINPAKPSFQFEKSAEDEIVFLPMENVSEDGEINQELRKQIKDVSSGFTYFEKGDVIVAKITPCFENGKGALLDELESVFGYGSTEFHTLRALKNINSRFLFYITKTERFMTIGEAFMTGSAGQKRVPSSFVENFLIGLPPIVEQKEINIYIETSTSKIDATITRIEKEIELLQEYRTALISEVVTGKIKVI